MKSILKNIGDNRLKHRGKKEVVVRDKIILNLKI